MISLLPLAAAALSLAAPPPVDQKAGYARWMASNTAWGFLSTISTRTNATAVGAAFGNPYSFADVAGVPYYYASDLDASMIDLFTSPTANPRGSFTTSDATLMLANGSEAVADCQIGAGHFGDPENPPCARLVLSGVFSKVDPGSAEETTALKSLFGRHPSFKNYPKGHSFYVAKLSIDGVWLIDTYGGAAIIKPGDYFSASAATALVEQSQQQQHSSSSSSSSLPALQLQSPPYWKHPETARWMVQHLTWGALSTVSVRTGGIKVGDAFGNPYSFADVNGVPYFFASDLDASMIDLFNGSSTAIAPASFTLSEAAESSGSFVHSQACKIGTYLGDPENPPCARLQLSGSMSKVAVGSDEETAAKSALFERHPSFKNYPAGHDFYVAKMTVQGIWLIDMFGGAAIIPPADYFKASPSVAQVA